MYGRSSLLNYLSFATWGTVLVGTMYIPRVHPTEQLPKPYRHHEGHNFTAII